MKTKIGYLIPEFPGQTHIFFWREICTLESMAVDVHLVSTRRPPLFMMSHTWSSKAEGKTTYLSPPQYSMGILIELFRCGPAGWFRCLWVILKAKKVSLPERLRLLALVLIGAELSHIAKVNKWKHVHVHSCADAANVAMFANLISQLSYSITLHGPLKDYGSNQEQKWHFANFAIVITKKLYEEVNSTLAGYLPRKVIVAPMGVDSNVFTRNTPYLPWDGNGKCLIFSCGRLNPCKGHADLITAIALLREKGINAVLEIAGEDEQGGKGYRKELEKLIKQLDLGNCVHLLGAVSEAKVKSCQEKAHIFALASLNEPLGVATMEAMMMELPVIVTGAGGVKELVNDRVDGLIVKPQAPAQLAETMFSLLADSKLSIRLGKAGREKIIKNFHSKRSAEALLNQISIGEKR